MSSKFYYNDLYFKGLVRDLIYGCDPTVDHFLVGQFNSYVQVRNIEPPSNDIYALVTYVFGLDHGTKVEYQAKLYNLGLIETRLVNITGPLGHLYCLSQYDNPDVGDLMNNVYTYTHSLVDIILERECNYAS